MPSLLPPPRMPRCSPLSRSFLSGQGLRSGVTWQLSRSEDRPDQLNHRVHALRGTPCCCLGFYGVGEPDGGGAVVPHVLVAGSLDPVCVVPSAFDGAGTGA